MDQPSPLPWCNVQPGCNHRAALCGAVVVTLSAVVAAMLGVRMSDVLAARDLQLRTRRRKGSQIYVQGQIRTRKYQDKDGVGKYATDIRVDQMQMLNDHRYKVLPRRQHARRNAVLHLPAPPQYLPLSPTAQRRHLTVRRSRHGIKSCMGYWWNLDQSAVVSTEHTQAKRLPRR